MGRHSKNAASRPFVNNHERQVLNSRGLGSQKVRFGGDYSQPFGFCCLSLQPVEDAMVSPSGHVYSREAIFEYLLAKKEEGARQQDAYDAQQRDAQQEVVQDARDAEAAAVRKFVDAQETTGGGARATGGKEPTPVRPLAAAVLRSEDEPSSKRARVASDGPQDDRPAIMKQTLIGVTEKVDKQKALKNSSFWLPMSAPAGAKTIVTKPERPKSPFSGATLRLKDLTPLPLLPSGDDVSEKAKAIKEGKYMCAMTKKDITHQAVVFLKPAGIVMLETAAKEVAYPTMTCPLSGKPFKKKDVIKLVTGGTGFASHNDVVATKYRTDGFGGCAQTASFAPASHDYHV